MRRESAIPHSTDVAAWSTRSVASLSVHFERLNPNFGSSARQVADDGVVQFKLVGRGLWRNSHREYLWVSRRQTVVGRCVGRGTPVDRYLHRSFSTRHETGKHGTETPHPAWPHSDLDHNSVCRRGTRRDANQRILLTLPRADQFPTRPRGGLVRRPAGQRIEVRRQGDTGRRGQGDPEAERGRTSSRPDRLQLLSRHKRTCGSDGTSSTKL